jgi:hypothetical protein
MWISYRAAINEHFAKVDEHLDAIDGKIEAFARRTGLKA